MLARIRAVQNDTEAGFTLVELLIVIVILGVLAGIVVFSVTGITNSSSASACKSDVKAIDTAAEAYYAQKNAAVTDLATLVSSGYLHPDGSISANTPNTETKGTYTITFKPGASGAGDATGTVTSGTGTC